MPKQSVCSALVHLNEYTVVARGETNPITYAEIEYLRFRLGEDAIQNIEVLRVEETTNDEALLNLRLTYGKDRIAEAFPGTKPRLPLEAPPEVPFAAGAGIPETPKGGRKRAPKVVETLPPVPETNEA